VTRERDEPGDARNRALRAGLFLLFEGLLVARAPNLLVAPRLYAEEGSRFFSFAFAHSVPESLAYVYSHAGYLNLGTNLAVTLAAHAVPLEVAPYVTVAVALGVQSLPFWILLYGRSALFQGWPSKIAACAIALFAPTVNAEVWLNTLQLQVFLGFVALLILFEELDGLGRLRRWTYRGLLALGGLTGVYTVFLQPVFLLRALRDRRRESVVQLAIVSAALLAQVVIVALTLSDNPRRLRSLSVYLSPDQALAYVSHFHLAVPLLGEPLAEALRERLGDLGRAGFFLLFAVAAAWTVRDWRQKRLAPSDARPMLLIAFALLAVATSLLALRGKTGGRYAVLSGWIVLLYLLAGARVARRRWIARSCAVFLAFALLAGARAYREPATLRCDGSHSRNDWRQEIARWRREPVRARFFRVKPSDQVAICPSGWPMQLERKPEGAR
jgi:hypothetical protein